MSTDVFAEAVLPGSPAASRDLVLTVDDGGSISEVARDHTGGDVGHCARDGDDLIQRIAQSTSVVIEHAGKPAPSARSIRHAHLTDLIGQVHDASYGTYGQPRVRAELQRSHGLVVGHNTVMLLMRWAGISGLPLRRRAKRVPARKRSPTWSSASSPPTARTGSGSPTSPSTPRRDYLRRLCRG